MSSAAVSPRPAQNWILNPALDALLIIAAPILAFLWALGTLRLFDAAMVYAVFAVCNVAHHFPTFIRIYGDADLLRRYRWELILGPIIPFGLALVAVVIIITSGIPGQQSATSSSSDLAFLFIVLLIWDPWHFLMQHYGFMRIYDRHNHAPRKIAARMDLAISWIWFICIMVLVLDWLPDLLYELKLKHGVSLIYLFSEHAYSYLETAMVILASGMGVVYLAYLVWCQKKGYYVSKAKLCMLAITFGVMYLTYVPNALMNRIAPDWNFGVGFATLGMVHVTQYFAIVWKYNRGLAIKNRARTKSFARAFAKGGVLAIAGYVVFCLLYGLIVSFHGVTLPFVALDALLDGEGAAMHSSRLGIWYGGIITAVAFTSTFLHYYYDGFMWKVRHKENRQSLALDGTGDGEQTSTSWFAAAVSHTAPRVLFRQALYLGIPIVFVLVTFGLSRLKGNPHEFMALAADFEASGNTEEMVQCATIALAEFEERLKLEQTMVQIRDHARHHAIVADLTYNIDLAKWRFLRNVPKYQVTAAQHEQAIQQAIAALETALSLEGTRGFSDEQDLRESAQRSLQQWKIDLVQARIERIAP